MAIDPQDASEWAAMLHDDGAEKLEPLYTLLVEHMGSHIASAHLDGVTLTTAQIEAHMRRCLTALSREMSRRLFPVVGRARWQASRYTREHEVHALRAANAALLAWVDSARPGMAPPPLPRKVVETAREAASMKLEE